MATTSSAAVVETGFIPMLSVVRLLVSGGITACAVFVLCWLGTFIPFASPTHAYIALFTDADISTGQALFEGTCWSLLFGALAGAMFALVYNTTAPLARK